MALLRELLTLIILSLPLSFASGPSTIFSKMEPLAINAKGEILCKSFYSKNAHGARSRYEADISIALCIVKEGKISVLHELGLFKPAFEVMDYANEANAYNEILNQYSAITFSKTSPLFGVLYEDFIQQGFKAIALENHRLAPYFSTNSFYETWGVHYQDSKQIVLNGESMPEVFEFFDASEPLKTVQLQYQIGNQIWLLADECPLEYEDARECSLDLPLNDGVRAMYYISPLYYQYKDTGLYGENPSPFGYEYQKVSAVIFLPEGAH